MNHRLIESFVAAALLLALVATPLKAAESSAIPTHSADGVTLWLLDESHPNDPQGLAQATQTPLSAEQLPAKRSGRFALSCKSLWAIFDPAKGELKIIPADSPSRERAAVRAEPALYQSTLHRAIAAANGRGPGVEIYSAYPDQPRLEYTVYLSQSGALEFAPAGTPRLVVDRCHIRYGIVPSLLGADLVYDPRQHAKRTAVHLPPMHWCLGLLDGEDAMLVATWPSKEQVVRLLPAWNERTQHFQYDRLSIDLAGQPFHLAPIVHRDIWRAVPLKDEYLETDTRIAWRRPFNAKWIGYIYVQSEEMHYPFYFRSDRIKLWGRWIKGWFAYPMWIYEGRTVLHFEKKFPPIGEALIYFFEPLEGGTPVPAPVEVLRQTLGDKLAAEIIDQEGAAGRVLLKHGHAVCAMTRKIQEAFNAGQETAQREEIAGYSDDVVTFIRLIRERIFEYRDFAKGLQEWEAVRVKENPKLAPALKPIGDLAAEILRIAEEKLPKASLEDVREWTELVKKLSAETDLKNKKEVKRLFDRCRGVAGTQDDQARDLCIRAIRIMEAAAEFGAESPERARLAGEILERARQVLRHPTWWEASRIYVAKPDPGTP